MIKNYFKTAWRVLWKNKVFSAINILGLALGMTCSLLILLWTRGEKSIDNFHVNGNRLYSIYERIYIDNTVEGGYSTPGLLPDQMKRDLPEVEMASGFTRSYRSTFQAGDKLIKENGSYAGADFFRMFSYPLLEGSPATALSSPISLAISRKMAVDFFGSPHAAIGQTLRQENKKEYKITAVFENPENASDKFDYLIGWATFLNDNDWARQWAVNGPNTFLLLRKDADPVAFKAKITHFLDNYNKAQSKAFRIQLGMERFGDRYLYSNFRNGNIEGGRIEYVHLFNIVAVFILLIACINFMNLTTARSLKRAKEIGIRKVIGARRSALIRQFMIEAIMLALLAVIIALGLVDLLLPGFNYITGKSISFPFTSYSFWISLAFLTLISGGISGSYPALFLSAFQPIRVLNGTLKFGAGAAWFRRILVIFQFILSTLLIIGTIEVSRQLNYVQSADLGYDRDNLITIHLEGDLPEKYTTFKQEARRLPGVADVTKVDQDPVDIGNGTLAIQWDGKDPNNLISFTDIGVSYDYVKTMHLQLLHGRDFSPEYATDTSGYILNEEALRSIGYKNPIGKQLSMHGKKGVIIGVVRDFHFSSLHEPIRPLIIFSYEGWHEASGNIMVRIRGGLIQSTLAQLAQLYRNLNPKFPFTYQFPSEEYRNLYQNEAIIHNLSDCFATLAIIISSLGLLGLSLFTVEQRVKEITIRKVLGASVRSLFILLSSEFLTLIFISLVIASPIAWYAMNKWLQNYAYHTTIEWWVFLLAGLIAILLTLITISFQAVKAAMANPIKSLRRE
jgi:putative ABC transport system permease protein